MDKIGVGFCVNWDLGIELNLLRRVQLFHFRRVIWCHDPGFSNVKRTPSIFTTPGPSVRPFKQQVLIAGGTTAQRQHISNLQAIRQGLFGLVPFRRRTVPNASNSLLNAGTQIHLLAHSSALNLGISSFNSLPSLQGLQCPIFTTTVFLHHCPVQSRPQAKHTNQTKGKFPARTAGHHPHSNFANRQFLCNSPHSVRLAKNSHLLFLAKEAAVPLVLSPTNSLCSLPARKKFCAFTRAFHCPPPAFNFIFTNLCFCAHSKQFQLTASTNHQIFTSTST